MWAPETAQEFHFLGPTSLWLPHMVMDGALKEEAAKVCCCPLLFSAKYKICHQGWRRNSRYYRVANEDSRRLAAILNNAHYLENLHFTIERTHTTSLSSGLWRKTWCSLVTLGSAFWRTVSMSPCPRWLHVLNGRTRRFADIQLQHGALCFNIRYGTTVERRRTTCWRSPDACRGPGLD